MLASARSGAGRASYVFNPLSTHWCYRADGSLACLVAEVHNTYGERHAYLLRPDDAGRAEADKEFYVSPFFAVAGRYLMRFSAPGPRLQITMALRQDGATPFTASVRGTARPATRRTVLRRRPPVPDDVPPGQRADPAARRKAVVAPTARRPSSPARRREPVVTTVQRPRGDEPTRFPVPRPDEAHWPGLATPPRAPVHAAHRRGPLPPRGGPAAGPRRLPRRPRARRRRQGRPGDAAGPAGHRLRPARRRREDRLRRGVHDRRLDDRPRHRPRRPAGAVRRAGCPPSCTRCCSGCGTWSSAPSPRTRRTAGRTAGPTSPGTTTCPTSCSSSSSTRR